MIKQKSVPKLNAIFYKSEMGSEPVKEWLLDLTKIDRRQVGGEISYVQFKWPIGKPQVDHLRGAIWEVRTTLKTRIARVLFAVEGNEMVLLHGFIKKTQATDKSDIDLAEVRYKDWKQHHEKK
ncbi:MAG: type II toxin-antitoxin system RelE/ParE family toxin [Undibacterium sp.]|jgi:phage-related protein|nr:type II toxin-antitoxin system RelE/ParE family toxin [Undibacterium sp.]